MACPSSSWWTSSRTCASSPEGGSANQQIPYAKSIMDYIFRWLGAKFLGSEYAVTEAGETMTLRPTEPDPQQELPFAPVTVDAPLCAVERQGLGVGIWGLDAVLPPHFYLRRSRILSPI